jgi:hypothetical protein
VLNIEQPPDIPKRPMGSIPVVARLDRPDGEEWWPGAIHIRPWATRCGVKQLPSAVQHGMGVI